MPNGTDLDLCPRNAFLDLLDNALTPLASDPGLLAIHTRIGNRTLAFATAAGNNPGTGRKGCPFFAAAGGLLEC
eukprot:symbB.v1.2.029021.t1/scaffold3125.1/size63008/8